MCIMQVLSRLLRSKNAEDLQAANRLIKNLVKQVALLSVVSVLSTVFVYLHSLTTCPSPCPQCGKHGI